MLLGCRTHVGSRHLSAQTARRGDRLKPCDTNTHDKRLGCAYGARGGHHHWKGTAVNRRGFDHSLISRQVRLRGQYVHRLRARDARHEFHRQRFHTSLGIIVDTATLAKGVKPRHQPSARLHPLQRFGVWSLNTQDNVRILQHRCQFADHSARSFIVAVTDGRTCARFCLDRNSRTQCNEFLNGLGGRRNAGFAWGGFPQYSDLNHLSRATCDDQNDKRRDCCRYHRAPFKKGNELRICLFCRFKVVIVCQNSLHINFYYMEALTAHFPMLKRDEQRKYRHCLTGSLPTCFTNVFKGPLSRSYHRGCAPAGYQPVNLV